MTNSAELSEVGSRRNVTTAGFTNGGTSGVVGWIDVQTPKIPDAMGRILNQQAQKHIESVERKKRLADQVETARVKVLKTYNIKTNI